MVIEVRPATAFEDVATMVGPRRADANACWCFSYRLPSKQNAVLTGPGRGDLVQRLCHQDLPPGVLAYDGDDVVGWAAVHPRADTAFARSRTIPRVDDADVWSVWCIRVRPGHRGKGISHRLPEGAVDFADSHGAPAIEGYPVDNAGGKVDTTMAYVGTRRLFEAAGFTKAADTASVVNGFPGSSCGATCTDADTAVGIRRSGPSLAARTHAHSEQVPSPTGVPHRIGDNGGVALLTESPVLDADAVRREAGRRRTFAVISHPDAGKSTLTEALALLARAIQDAGVTHGKSSRHATVSDWMGIEQERGISISSAALQLTYRDTVLNVVDTPGHADFSEDTYRVLAAVDSAVMLIDAAKGFEPQTVKLLAVCKARNIPIITVINKWDRPGLDALGLIDDVGERTGMTPVPLTWPAGIAGEFQGLLDLRAERAIALTAVGAGAQAAQETDIDIDALDPRDAGAWLDAREESGLVESSHGSFDREEFEAARQTPVLFAAAAKNFGVSQLLDILVDVAPSPSPRPSREAEPRPIEAPMSGFVFKVQAGQDSAHRDHIAYLRICSGTFERGMVITNQRTGKPFATKYAHRVLGRSREVVDTAWPGDVVGLVNATSLRVGDSLFADEPVQFPDIPRFSPELFAVARAKDPGRYKQFRRGIEQLEHEGVVQVLRSDLRGDQAPVLAAVGSLQFEVAAQRLGTEFNAPTSLDNLSHTLAMRVAPESQGVPETFRGGEILYRSDGDVVAIFGDKWKVGHFRKDYPDVVLEPIGAAVDL